MNAKLNFLKHAITRIENDREFMAYTLKKYCEFEKISEPKLMEVLGCSIEDYYKLALCKVPDIQDSNFGERLTIISEHTNILAGRLTAVIKQVNIVLKFKEAEDVPTLMAARDKEEGKNDKK